MGTDISVQTEDTFLGEDRTWTATRKGYDTNKTVTLDVSTFVAAHIADKGGFPSGTVLGKITASGKYGPYDPAEVDGREVATGFLFTTSKVGEMGSDTDLTTAADIVVPMMREAVIVEANLPVFSGTAAGELDAGARTDLAGRFIFE
jgi:hypothetical protein